MGRFPKTWLCLLVVVLVHCCSECSSVSFQLVTSSSPLVVNASDDVMLPCVTHPMINAEGFNVEWLTMSQHEGTNKVHTFKQGQDQNAVQIASFRGRTDFFPSELQNGNFSLRLRNARPTDTRDYICLAASSLGQHYAIVKLIVRAKGTKPEVSTDACEDNGVCRLVCKSSGWSPKPAIDWLDGRKRKLTSDPPLITWESQGYTVQRRLLVETGYNHTYICRVSEKDRVEQTEIHV